jgi:hypothetical protein
MDRCGEKSAVGKANGRGRTPRVLSGEIQAAKCSCFGGKRASRSSQKGEGNAKRGSIRKMGPTAVRFELTRVTPIDF